MTGHQPYPDGPRLLADIGGTRARFALERLPGAQESMATFATADDASLEAAMVRYLRGAGVDAVRHAAIAIATPVSGDGVRMTNHHWEFSIAVTKARLGLETLLVVNDFAALARAVPLLAPGERVAIGDGVAVPDAVIAVTGPGTGLGVAGLVPCRAGALARFAMLTSEGGHATYAPADAREQAVVEHARRSYEHVSAERLISGPGLELIHAALHAKLLDAQAISELARAGDAAARETVLCLFGMLGAFAGNLALTLGARGGVYIGGGIAPAKLELRTDSQFRERFEAKGRFSDWLRAIPVFVIDAKRPPAIRGAAALLGEALGEDVIAGGGAAQ